MRKALIMLLLFGVVKQIKAQVWLEQTVIDSVTVAENLEIPWEMEWWNNDTILFTERTGAIKRLAVSSGQVDVLRDPHPDLANEQQAGLMGLQMHPQFPLQPYVYCVEAVYQGNGIVSEVKRLRYDKINDELVEDSIVVADLPASNSNLGGRLLISSLNEMYLTLGDIKDNASPQDLASLNGKVLRYNLDGTIPADNPFPDNPVYTFGHRNPQGLAEDEQGNIWISEHGPSSNDELNKLISGRNYGWPLISGYCQGTNIAICDSLNLVSPYYAWSPTIAPGGMAFVNATNVPEWKNTFLIASLKEQRLMTVYMDDDLSEVNFATWIFQYQFGRLRDVLVSPEGRLFVCTSNRDALGSPRMADDRIIELVPTAHNGVGQFPASFDFSVLGKRLKFTEKFSGNITVSSALGQVLLDEVIIDQQEINLDNMPSNSLIMIQCNKDGVIQTTKAILP